jgi:PKD repeat protein
MAKQQKGTVSTDYREDLKWGIILKLKQTMGIVLISILLSSVTAIAASAEDTTLYDTMYKPMYDTMYKTMYDAMNTMNDTMYNMPRYDTRYNTPNYDTRYNTPNYDTRYNTRYNTPRYDTRYNTRYNTTTLTSNTEVYAPKLIAAFTATHDPSRPLTIRFKEETTGEPVPYMWGGKEWTYYWGFGDNTTSNQQNPVHQFKEPGRYKVNFQVRNADNQISKAVMHIDVADEK